MDNENLSVIVMAVVTLAAVGMTVYRTWHSHQPVTLEGVAGTLQESTTTAKELSEVALTATKAAEQLFNSGRITKDERFNKAVQYMRRWFPDLDEDILITNLEAAVLVVNSIVIALPRKRLPE